MLSQSSENNLDQKRTYFKVYVRYFFDKTLLSEL